jgi:hypothetical protein
MNWKNININTNLIKTETEKAVLFKMPHNSKYDGYVFWHSSKLVRNGRHSAAVSVGYTEEFQFNLKKYGNGVYNRREVISEKTIGVSEFEEAFGIIDKNISKKEFKNPYETHKPVEKEAEKAEAIDELKDE